jgi:hypothetical protein
MMGYQAQCRRGHDETIHHIMSTNDMGELATFYNNYVDRNEEVATELKNALDEVGYIEGSESPNCRDMAKYILYRSMGDDIQNSTTKKLLTILETSGVKNFCKDIREPSRIYLLNLFEKHITFHHDPMSILGGREPVETKELISLITRYKPFGVLNEYVTNEKHKEKRVPPIIIEYIIAAVQHVRNEHLLSIVKYRHDSSFIVDRVYNKAICALLQSSMHDNPLEFESTMASYFPKFHQNYQTQ